ncbi:hypothetical protein FB451DRAFT_1556975 [Mycena latifolia]|nr:hypothetical protein FB451DRAFT_1556975 [Mycena latifolia]
MHTAQRRDYERDSSSAEFTPGCAEVAVSTVYLTISTINADGSTGAFLTTLKQHFDILYDTWIPSLDLFVNFAMAGSAGYYSPAGMAGTIEQICICAVQAQSQTCVGDDTLYVSPPACVQTLAEKPFGRLDEPLGDSVVCRSIHVLLTKFRPEVHCPHVGPTGGGKSVHVAYNDV